MKLFLKIVLILSPSLLVIGLLTGILYYIGEFMPVDEAIRRQLSNPQLIVNADGNFSPFKWAQIQQLRPKILVVGSSRVMAFRSHFFHKQASDVYNAGMDMRNIWRILWILQSLKEQSILPETLIVGFDQDWFVPGRSSKTAISSIEISEPENPSPDLAYLLNSIRRIVGQILDNRYLLSDILDRRDPFYETDALGFNAIATSSGFRPDGSHVNNLQALNNLPESVRFSNVRQLIEANSVRFTRSDEPDDEAFEAVQQLIQFCIDNHIELIAFSPPYAPAIYTELEENGGYGYIAITTQRLQTIFDESPFLYMDFTDAQIPNTANENYLDGNHGSEFVYLNLYLELLQQSAALQKYSDIAYLETWASAPSSKSRFDVFGMMP